MSFLCSRISAMDLQIQNMAHILENEPFFKTAYPEAEEELKQVPMRARPSWQDIKITDLEYDNELMVTHVNQTHDLLRIKDMDSSSGRMQTSEEWLCHYGIDHLDLTIQDLLKKGHISMKPNCGSKHIEFTAQTVNEFELRIHKAIELYQQRIRWLMEGSRKMFGLIKGERAALLIDSSDLNCGPRRMDFLRAVLCLTDEQLAYKERLFLSAFGTDVSRLWDTPRDVNISSLHEARQWIQKLQPAGSCNLLQALRNVLQIQEIDSLVIVVSSCPDQTPEVLSAYLQQCTLGRNLQIHTVAFDSIGQDSLQNFAEAVDGRFHCYSSWKEDEIYKSTDVHLLLNEKHKAVDTLNKIQEMRQGKLGDALISVMQELSSEVAKIPSSVLLPKPPNHDGPLNIEIPSFLPKTSAEWLKKNGLKAKKLNLYQVLAPNAYSPIEEFVPILQKTVSSTLHERAMMQFEWHDGSVKNIHVDPPLLYDYQKQLAKVTRTYEKRIDWLTTGSRRLWGTVCEKSVVLLVDISAENAMHIIHIQHALRLLLEEQTANKDFINIIAFGSDIKSWKSEMVSSTPKNLQNAWKWILGLQCAGGRNILGAIKLAIEANFIDKENQESQGIYLFSSGVPDQEAHSVYAYLLEATSGYDLQLNVCLFDFNEHSNSIDDKSNTVSILKDLAHVTDGRFHWFDGKGILESDDISYLVAEMEKAVNYSRKCAYLVESLKQRSGVKEEEEKTMIPFPKEQYRPKKLPLPKPTALSLARMSIKDDQEDKKERSVKALMWRPNSAKADIPPAWPTKDPTSVSKKVKKKDQAKMSLSVFYTESGKNVGVVYKEYPPARTVRKAVPFIVLPKEEAICSTKGWLKKFSLKKLRLELPKLMFGPDCTHQKKMVPALHKKVSAKYCTIFPSVEVNGVVKHLQFQPKELAEYIEQLEKVLRRYIQRMQWLLSGSRRLFGTVLENKVCILIDSSSSMAPYLVEVQKGLTTLIWEQLRTQSTWFNMISFSESMESWQDCLVEGTDEACHDAVQWLSRLKPCGNTCTFHALQKGFEIPDVQGLYLLSDGKADASYNIMAAESLLKSYNIKIHTISFNTTNKHGTAFLKTLSAFSGGRYHACHADKDGLFVAHRMLTEGFTDEDDPVLPVFEGDDLKILCKEIRKARHYISQARSFRFLVEEKQKADYRGASLEGSELADDANGTVAGNIL
ncbi:von Willebrand factor A domain-containing protein 3A [Bombina bombina]|uniref:von Willebrand factor A domain-containing protein 3A n=1 Tax=Bombina bombina TaxID=8345 RepID=UPI00235AB4DC|nr:von Willebrand factor A domain-containing protein 3A [Bombina bombina]